MCFFIIKNAACLSLFIFLYPLENEAFFLFLASGAGATAAARLSCGDVLTNLADKFIEDLIDIRPCLCRGGKELHPKVARQVLCLLLRDLASLDEVALVANEDEGYGVSVVSLEDAEAQLCAVIERDAVNEGEYEEEALAVLHVLVTHGAVLLLARCVEDVEEAGDVVHSDLLAVTVLNGGVIFLNKVVLHK